MSEGRYPITSRYHGIETTVHETADGRKIVHLRRRFVPPPESHALLHEHTVVEGDRPDTVAAQHLGDPEQSWRIADANGVLRPEELTEEVGRLIRITLPEGIPGGGP